MNTVPRSTAFVPNAVLISTVGMKDGTTLGNSEAALNACETLDASEGVMYEQVGVDAARVPKATAAESILDNISKRTNQYYLWQEQMSVHFTQSKEARAARDCYISSTGHLQGMT